MPDPPSSASVVATRKRVERLAALLDGAIRIPGTRFRFGIEALI